MILLIEILFPHYLSHLLRIYLIIQNFRVMAGQALMGTEQNRIKLIIFFSLQRYTRRLLSGVYGVREFGEVPMEHYFLIIMKLQSRSILPRIMPQSGLILIYKMCWLRFLCQKSSY